MQDDSCGAAPEGNRPGMPDILTLSGPKEMDLRLKIIAVGNPNRRDDQVPVLLSRPLAKMVDEGICVRQAIFPGVELLDEFIDDTPIAFIYAFVGTMPPGSVICYRWRTGLAVQLEQHRLLPEDHSVFECLALAEELGHRLPQIYFVGIAARDLDEGEQITPEMSAVMPAIIVKVRKLIAAIAASPQYA